MSEEILVKSISQTDTALEMVSEAQAIASKAIAQRDELADAIDCACNALTDSINVSGNDAQTNMHWVRKLRSALSRLSDKGEAP